MIPCLALCVALAAASGGVSAQSSAPTAAPDDSISDVATAPVKVDGRVLFLVRGVSAYPADKRAQIIADRIVELASDPAFDSRALSMTETPFATIISGGKLTIMTVLDSDGQLEHVARQNLARADLLRIQEAIEAFRRDRHPRLLITHAAFAFVALLALAAFLLIGARLSRRIVLELELRYRHRIGEVGIQGLKVLPAERMWGSVIAAVKFLAAAIGFAACYVALDYVFSLFPWTWEISYNLSAFFLNPLRAFGARFLAKIPDLILLLVLGLLTYYFLKFIRLVFGAIETGAITLSGFEASWAKPTYRLVRGFVIAFALVIAFPYIPGSNTQAFKGVSLFIGLVFSLGSTSLIGNLVSGYSLTYRGAFRQGDRVKIGEFAGDVQESRLLVTYLRTPKNEVIAIPNSAIVNTEVINYSSLAQSQGLILHTSVGIGYEVPWRQVEAMLLAAAEKTPGLLSEPKPFVRELSLRSFDVEYELNVYCDNPHRMEGLRALLHRNILDLFNEYGVQIMTPAYEGDPEDVKVVAKDRWFAAPAVPDTPHNTEGTEGPQPGPRKA